MQRRLFYPIAILIIVSIAGCAVPLSKESRKKVDTNVTFEQLIANPDMHVGKTVMFGGDIISCIPFADRTEVEIIQKPLGSRSIPKDTDDSAGRFLFVSKSFLDPAVYSPGRVITVIGVVRGSGKRSIGSISYRYPIIEEVEHHLWSPRDLSPGMRFGVGVGVGVGVPRK